MPAKRIHVGLASFWVCAKGSVLLQCTSWTNAPDVSHKMLGHTIQQLSFSNCSISNLL